MGQEILRVAAGDHRPRFRVEEYAVVADRENARQFMRDHQDGGAQTVAQVQDQIVEQARADRIESRRRLVKKKISGSSAMARASPARFCMPPLISDG